MAKAKFDSKKIKAFLFEKGERVALYGAAGLVVLMFVYCVYVLLFGSSPYGDIHRNVQDLENKIAQATPDAGGDAVKVDAVPIYKLGLPGNKFTSVAFFVPEEGTDNKRQKPPLLPLDIARAADPKDIGKPIQVAFVRGPVYVYKTNDLSKTVQGKGIVGKLPPNGVGGNPKFDPYLDVLPVNLVEVSLTFSYKDQARLYEKALRILPPKNLKESKDTKDFKELFALGLEPRIEGLIVTRHEKTADGQTKSMPIYFAGEGGKTEVAPAIRTLLRKGIYDEANAAYIEPFVMPRGSASPRIELAYGEYPALKKLGGINPKGDMPTPRPRIKEPPGGGGVIPLPGTGGKKPDGKPKPINPVNVSDTPFDSLPSPLKERFALNQINPLDPYGTFPPQPVLDDKGKPVIPVGGQAPAGGARFAKPLTEVPADGKTLVRFIDVELKPGVTYWYTVQLRMANPNYQKKELVSYPALALPSELLSPEATTPPFTMPGDYHFYFVDQHDLVDPKVRNPFKTLAADEVAVQVHRWVEAIQDAKLKSRRIVADWAVAERIEIHRGEPIAKMEDTEVRAWNQALEKFELAGAAKSAKGPHLAPVNFYVPEATPTLVDFAGGKTGGDYGTLEVLLLGPDGKLFVRNNREDNNVDAERGRERKERYDSWRQHIDSLR